MYPEFKLILASGSPRRKELLNLLELPFKVQPGQIDESINAGEKPLNYIKRMAEEKSNAGIYSENAWVLSADTIVEYNGQVIGKPKDAVEADEILKFLRAKDHHVFTALNLLHNGQSNSNYCKTTVSMRAYSDDEIKSYILTNSPMDKAGAYAIQDANFHPVNKLQGCWANVMGLPLCHLYVLARQSGLMTEPGIADRCQNHLGIVCPVFAEILNEA